MSLNFPAWNPQGIINARAFRGFTSMGRPWWHHRIETFSPLPYLFEGNPPVTDDFPSQRANDAEHLCFLWPVPEQAIKQTIETPPIWDAIALIMTSLQWIVYSGLGQPQSLLLSDGYFILAFVVGCWSESYCQTKCIDIWNIKHWLKSTRWPLEDVPVNLY